MNNNNIEKQPREQITPEELFNKIRELEPGETFHFSTGLNSDTYGITRLKIFDGDILLLGYLGGQQTSLFNLVNQQEDAELPDWVEYCIGLNYDTLYRVYLSNNISYPSKENIVSSYFFYMWNAWCKEECKAIFGWEWEHFWNKWCGRHKKNPYGAAEGFYDDLSVNNRVKLVNHACEVYDGNKRREKPKETDNPLKNKI